MNENAYAVTATVMEPTYGGELYTKTRLVHTREKGVEWAIDWAINRMASTSRYNNTIADWKEDLEDYGVATWQEYVKKSLLEDEELGDICYIEVDPVKWLD